MERLRPLEHEARPEEDDPPGYLYNTRDLRLSRLVSGEVEVSEIEIGIE